MSRRTLLASLALSILGPLIFGLLLRRSGLGLSEVSEMVTTLKPAPVALIVAATALHIALAGWKWRLVEARFVEAAPSLRRAAAYSAMGTALGQFLPTPLANAATRGVGNRLARGEGGRRGALTSVWEQLFDFGVVAVLCAPAAASLILLDPLIFYVGAPAALILADLLVGPVVGRVGRRVGLPAPLCDARLTSQLYRVSLLRFAVLVLITASVVWAMGSAISIPGLMIALPPVAVGSVLSFLPAGLGVNEWSFVVLLGRWGEPFAAVAAFAVVNRLLLGSASFGLGSVGLMLVGGRAIGGPRISSRGDDPQPS